MNIAYAAEAVHETTQAAEDIGLLASLGINPTLFIFQLINFIVVALIIWFLILKPLTQKMTERSDKITEGLIKAEEVEANLRKSEQKYQEKIDDAKSEAAKILSQANVESLKLGEKLKIKSQKEIQLLVDQAKRNIQIEKEEMMGEVKKEAGVLITNALEKILEEKIDDIKDKEIIIRSVKNIKV